MLLILEVVFASIAAVLSLLSLRTMRTIKHLGVGKSFWTPMFVSGVLFLVGSIVAVLNELNFSFTTYSDELVQVIRLVALCTLVGGVYSYARRVSKNLGLKLSVLQKSGEKGGEVETEVPSAVPVARTAHAPVATIQERLAKVEENLKREAAQECRHELGYLRTLPRDASIPDECFSCDKIIECKHSTVKPLESQANPPSEPSE